MPLLSTIIERLERRSSRSGILLAWSGGLDSTVLLHLLMAWSRHSGEAIAAVHVDHQLRESSRADRAFCQRIARRWGVALGVETLEMCLRGSMQESARVQRYAALARTAQTLGLGSVATAHHADDAIETALLNFRRGTSSAGLSSGLSPTDRPIPGWPDLALIRPLVHSPRRELLAYAEAHDLAWQTDPTNAQTNYARNRLRQQALPSLTDGGDLISPIIDTLENLASERRAIEAMADECLTRTTLARPDAESVAMDCEPLHSTPRAVVVVAVQKLIGQLPAEVGLGRDHLKTLVRAITAPTPQKSGPDTLQMVPDTVRMAVRGGFICLDRGLLIAEIARGRGGKHLHDRVAHPVGLDGSDFESAAPWFSTRLHLDRLEERSAPVSSNHISSKQVSPNLYMETSMYMETSTADTSWIVRGPRPGDRLDARGMHGHKSVTDVLSEAGVPRAFRWRWPVVVRDEQTRDVAWICGLRRGARPTHTDGAASASRLRLRWEVDPGSVFARILSRSQHHSQPP
jgi:tRNA(Ile)-lysidine synthetase-like protein